MNLTEAQEKLEKYKVTLNDGTVAYRTIKDNDYNAIVSPFDIKEVKIERVFFFWYKLVFKDIQITLKFQDDSTYDTYLYRITSKEEAEKVMMNNGIIKHWAVDYSAYLEFKYGRSYRPSTYTPISAEPIAKDTSTEDFVVSAAIGAITDSALLGGFFGGSFLGGAAGDALDGDLFD